MKVPTFIAAEACGNQFFIYEMAEGDILAELQGSMIAELSTHQRDSGLVLEGAGPGVWAMHVIEKDGTLSSFCGNGARAVVLYLYQRYGLEEAFLLNSKGRRCRLEYKEGIPSVSIDFVHMNGNVCEVLDEPHIIYQEPPHRVKELALLHANVNVSCMQPLAPNRWKIVTWERGVNATTLSCGSGCVAAMYRIAAQQQQDAPNEIVFECPGGENKVCKRGDSYILSGSAFVDLPFQRPLSI